MNFIIEIPKKSIAQKLKQIIDIGLTKKIILHGKVSQIKLEKLYSQCDFYISTSKYEGFGMSLANGRYQNCQ